MSERILFSLIFIAIVSLLYPSIARSDYEFIPVEKQIRRADLIVTGIVAKIAEGEMGSPRKVGYEIGPPYDEYKQAMYATKSVRSPKEISTVRRLP